MGAVASTQSQVLEARNQATKMLPGGCGPCGHWKRLETYATLTGTRSMWVPIGRHSCDLLAAPKPKGLQS